MNDPSMLSLNIEELDLSVRSFNILRRHGVTTIADLTKSTLLNLCSMNHMNRKCAEEVIQKLSMLGCELADSTDGKYKSIDSCFRYLHRQNKLKTISTIRISVREPDYGSFNRGGKGYTLYFNIENLTSDPIKLKLSECAVFTSGRQWVSEYNYTGYAFDEDYVFPTSPKTVGKIWITENTSYSQIMPDDHFTLVLTAPALKKLFYFKFIFSQVGTWEIYDYYELDE